MLKQIILKHKLYKFDIIYGLNDLLDICILLLNIYQE